MSEGKSEGNFVQPLRWGVICFLGKSEGNFAQPLRWGVISFLGKSEGNFAQPLRWGVICFLGSLGDFRILGRNAEVSDLSLGDFRILGRNAEVSEGQTLSALMRTSNRIPCINENFQSYPVPILYNPLDDLMRTSNRIPWAEPQWIAATVAALSTNSSLGALARLSRTCRTVGTENLVITDPFNRELCFPDF